MKLKQLKTQIINKRYMYIIKKVKTKEYYSEYAFNSLTKDRKKATVFYGKENLDKFLEDRPQFKVGRFYRICQIGYFFDN